MRNIRRKQVHEIRKKKRLIFLTFGMLLFIYLTLNMIIGESGLFKYMELRSMKSRLTAETGAIKKQNEDIVSQTDELKKDPGSMEGLARDYGLSKKGELIFKFDKQ